MSSIKMYNGFTLVFSFLTAHVDMKSLRKIANANGVDYLVIRNSLGVEKSIIL